MGEDSTEYGLRDQGLSEVEAVRKGKKFTTAGIKARGGELRNQSPSLFDDGRINSQLGNNMLLFVSDYSKYATEP